MDTPIGGARGGAGRAGPAGQAVTNDGASTPPPSRRIADHLREAIAEGEYAPGARLPSERALADQWEVARNTARQAIAFLQAEGLVEAVHGSGVYVREQPALIRLAADRYRRRHREGTTGPFAAEVERLGASPRVEVLEISEVGPPREVVERLGIDEDEPVLCRRNRCLVDERPVQLVDTYVPRPVAAGTRLDREDPGPGGIYAELERAGWVVATIDETVTARMPDPGERERLALPPGVPLLELWHTSLDDEERPFEVTHFRLAADRNALGYRFPVP